LRLTLKLTLLQRMRKFQNFVNEVMEYVIVTDFDTVEDILAGEINGQPFIEYLALQIATIG